MMTGADKPIKASPAPKKEAAAKSKSSPGADQPKPESSSGADQSKPESSSGADQSKPESTAAAADAPSGYSRGEGQKPVSKAYKDNWNLIFGKKKRR
jgi:hypothetical protein